jgi:hypothetical protein
MTTLYPACLKAPQGLCLGTLRPRSRILLLSSARPLHVQRQGMQQNYHGALSATASLISLARACSWEKVSVVVYGVAGSSGKCADRPAKVGNTRLARPQGRVRRTTAEVLSRSRARGSPCEGLRGRRATAVGAVRITDPNQRTSALAGGLTTSSCGRSPRSSLSRRPRIQDPRQRYKPALAGGGAVWNTTNERRTVVAIQGRTTCARSQHELGGPP